MNDARVRLAKEYALALGDYFDGVGESALLRAYDIGRRAVAAKLGVLDTAALHQEALVGALLHKLAPEDHTRIAHQAAEFFSEALAPFEMTRRGDQEANGLLRDLNLELDSQVRERTRTLELTLADLHFSRAEVDEHVRIERMKDEFVAMVSHELRTPLTSIRGSLSLLSAGVMGPLPAEAREAVEIAERNALRLITLVHDILDWDKLEHDKKEMRLSPQPLQPLIDRALETVRPAAALLKVRLAANATPARVQADGDRLVMVLVNLLSNAIKYSPPGGSVTLGAAAADGQVEVTVTDTGCGIAPDHQRSIFDRFWQVQTSEARLHTGSGLGLAICRSIIEYHRGTIGVDSVPGQGSRFWFRIPVAAAAPGEAQ